MAQNCKELEGLFVGDTLTIRILAKKNSIDFTAYTITSELRTNGGEGALAGTFTVIKDAPDVDGNIFGFTAVLSAAVTASLIPKVNYGIDYRFLLGGAEQHSGRVVIKFDKAVTVA